MVGEWCGTVNLSGECSEVDMMLQHRERIAKLAQLGFALLVDKQNGLDQKIVWLEA
jgi:hypothetical protein